MIGRIFFSAIGAGLCVGLITAAMQHFTTTPLIIAAEAYENAGEHHHASLTPQRAGVVLVAAHEHGEDAAATGAEPWAPADGIERTFFTSLSTTLAGVGFALMLLAAMVLRGGRIDGRTGLLWGIGGFAAISLAPAFGLPPELPGSAAAELFDRQVWWAGTALASAGGIGLVVFARTWAVRGAGIVLVLAPHLIGAPHPHEFASTVPAELAGHFAAASLALSAVFWALLGWGSGTAFERLDPDRATTA